MRQFFRTRKNSFSFAFQGISYALRTQPNTRIHLTLTVIALLAAFYLRASPLEWAVIIIAAGLVWMAELFNSAIEAVFDYLSPPYHPLVKAAKDVSAAAVLVAAIAAFLIGVIILGIPLLTMLLKIRA